MDELVVQGRMSQGYGSIPKLVMKDRRLSIQSKSIYAYFCSYAGAGATAFPTVNQVIADLKISKETFQKHRKLLEDNGYIIVEQKRNDRGLFARNVYTLCELIKYEESEPEPLPVSPCTVSPSSVSSVAGEVDTNNNIYINNNILNNNNINNNSNTSQSVSQSEKNNKNKKSNKKESQPMHTNAYAVKPSIKKSIDNYNTYKQIIQENIEYNQLVIECDENELAFIDEMIAIMLDTILSKGDLKIGGELKSRELVAGVYLKLNLDHILYARQQYLNTTDVVKNKKGYIQTILYNSFHEFRADVENFVKTYPLRKPKK